MKKKIINRNKKRMMKLPKSRMNSNPSFYYWNFHWKENFSINRWSKKASSKILLKDVPNKYSQVQNQEKDTLSN